MAHAIVRYEAVLDRSDAPPSFGVRYRLRLVPCLPLAPSSPPRLLFHADACPVCHEEAGDEAGDEAGCMRVLSCGHMLCTECLDRMRARACLCDDAGRVRCPQCRAPSDAEWPAPPSRDHSRRSALGGVVGGTPSS